jgi:hypothetical protein
VVTSDISDTDDVRVNVSIVIMDEKDCAYDFTSRDHLHVSWRGELYDTGEPISTLDYCHLISAHQA